MNAGSFDIMPASQICYLSLHGELENMQAWLLA
jgi:hypothetical protein